MITDEELAGLVMPETEEQIEDFELVNQMEIIRRDNNIKWMGILKLAIKGFPEETKALMKGITNNDMKVTELSKRLGEKNTFGG